MNAIKTNGAILGESFYLTEVLGARVYRQDRHIGKLNDVVALDRDKVAEVTHIRVSRPFGEKSLLIPLAKVRSLEPGKTTVEAEDLESYSRELQADEVLLNDYLLDKKVLDVEDRDVEVVYDLRLVRVGDKTYVTDVDISRYGLLRRMGLKSIASIFYETGGETSRRLIPWSYIEPLPAELGTLQGNVKLSVLKETLGEIHPADLADILEELDSHQRATVLEGLDTEHASDTLEEIDPAIQRDIVFTLRKERVAQLISEMTPAQAADIISVLPADEKRTILKLLKPPQVARIEEIIEKPDVSILDFMIARFFKFGPEMTVEQARTRFREEARSRDVREYFYIVNSDSKLIGVASLDDVFMSADNTPLKDLMVENVITLRPETTVKEAANMFMRYLWRALPVVDTEEKILGVVPYRDVMQLKHRMLE